MTPSEKLIALAEERANSPENMQEMLALVIDRATASTVNRINYEIGHDVQFHPRRFRGGFRPRKEPDYDRALTEYSNITGESDYEKLLREYVELKLYLHSMRKSMYYPYDAYAEREGDFSGVLERCRELRTKIKELRGGFSQATWGQFAPEPAVTVNDKPLLYAMDDYSCSYWFADPETGEHEAAQCQVAGEYWYAGLPYCRSHQGQARREAKERRRYLQSRAKSKFHAAVINGDWSVEPDPPKKPCTYRDPFRGGVCGRQHPHGHYGGRIENF